MAKIEEIQGKLANCRTFLGPYSGYGELVTRTIEDIRRMEDLMKEPTKENASKALQIMEEIEGRIGPYASYVPDLMVDLSYVKDELKKI